MPQLLFSRLRYNIRVPDGDRSLHGSLPFPIGDVHIGTEELILGTADVEIVEPKDTRQKRDGRSAIKVQIRALAARPIHSRRPRTRDLELEWA